MTTIVYHHESGIIAADGRVTSGSRISTDSANKIIESNGSIFAMCGATSDWADFVEEFKNGEKVSRDFDCSAIMATGGLVYIAGIDRETKTFFASPQDHSIAIGSGGDFALASMDFGNGAVDAVKYAATRDSSTGGKISEVSIR